MESSSTKNSEPQLQPPGAGLPFIQAVFTRRIVGPIVSKLVPMENSRRDFQNATQTILDQISKLPREKRFQKILVDPIIGLEDSSRYWSLNDVLEHLLMVSKAFESVLKSLSEGKIPPGQADPVRVKPKNIDRDLFEEFSSYAPELMKRLDAYVNTAESNNFGHLKFPHKWFGPMNSRQWFWLVGRHQSIHSKQVRAIVKGL